MHNIQSETTLTQLVSLLEEEKQHKEQLLQNKHVLETRSREIGAEIATNISNQVEECAERFSNFQMHVKKECKNRIPQKLENPEICLQLDGILLLEKSKDYIKVFQYIRYSSERIEQCLQSRKTLAALDFFRRLQLIQEVHLQDSQCTTLASYCSKSVSFWECELIKRISRDFETSLEEMGWPVKIVQSNPSTDQKCKFNVICYSIVNLSKLLPDTNKQKDCKKPPLLVDFLEPSLPVGIILKPLKKRFRFNFFGTNIMSKVTKPEWYFTQVKNWIRDLLPFVKEHLEEHSTSVMQISSLTEFVRGLSELIVIKADAQLLASLNENDNLTFAKILEESIIYENEVGQVLRSASFLPNNYIAPLVSTLFSRPRILNHWLTLEKKTCLEKLDEIFASPSAWDRAVLPGPPEIVHFFLTLLLFMTDRFSHLQQPGHRIEFLQLLVDTIDDFRYRCFQIWQSKSQPVEDLSATMLFDYVMADGLWHIQMTLDTWEDLPLFESLSFFLDNIQEAEEQQARLLDNKEKHVLLSSGFQVTDGVLEQFVEIGERREHAVIGTPSRGLFSDLQNLYTCFNEEILSSWIKNVMKDIGEPLISCYKSVKWHCLPEQSLEDGVPKISQQFLIPLQNLSSLCKVVENGIVPLLAERWLKRLAVSIDDMLMQRLIIPTKFSRGAIRQIKQDLQKGLFPTFAEYDIETSLFLSGLTSAIKVWDMSLGDAMLLFDELTDSDRSLSCKEELLAELEITLKPSEVLRLVKTRTDIIC